MGTAIYPGSFDPVTNGHLDIIERGSRLFGHLIVAILKNPKKDYLFSTEERMYMLRESTRHLHNVEIDSFSGLLVEYAKVKKARVIIKGLRAISDFEYEFQMAMINKKLSPGVETLFMMTNNKYSYLSSSVVKEIAFFHGNVNSLVPPIVSEFIYEKIKNKYGEGLAQRGERPKYYVDDLDDDELMELIFQGTK